MWFRQCSATILKSLKSIPSLQFSFLFSGYKNSSIIKHVGGIMLLLQSMLIKKDNQCIAQHFIDTDTYVTFEKWELMCRIIFTFRCFLFIHCAYNEPTLTYEHYMTHFGSISVGNTCWRIAESKRKSKKAENYFSWKQSMCFKSMWL